MGITDPQIIHLRVDYYDGFSEKDLVSGNCLISPKYHEFINIQRSDNGKLSVIRDFAPSKDTKIIGEVSYG